MKTELSRERSLEQQDLRTKERKVMKIRRFLREKGEGQKRRRIGMMTFGLMLTELVGILVWWKGMKVRTE
eukprot:10602770-Karenia_brevis.AAC.1